MESIRRIRKVGFENKFRKKTFYMGCGAETKDLLILEVQKGCYVRCFEIGRISS